MVFRGIKMPVEMVERLQQRAIVETVKRGRPVYWSEVVREAVERILSEPEPTVTLTDA